jgi:flagellin
VAYGSDSFVSVQPLNNGSFTLTDAASSGAPRQRDEGQDAEAMINGHRSVGRGLELNLNTTTLDMTLALVESFGMGTTSFAITGGGALFQLGPNVDANQQVNIGLQSVAASSLGNGVVGFLTQITTEGEYSLLADGAARASLIVKEAVRQVSVLRGRLGSFERNTLQTNINSLNITMENLTSAESGIRDADFAQETSNLTRSQILVQAGTSVLSMANSTPQSVLSLLQGG